MRSLSSPRTECRRIVKIWVWSPALLLAACLISDESLVRCQSRDATLQCIDEQVIRE